MPVGNGPGENSADVLFEIITRRRSVRSFRSDPVPDDLIDRLIEAARWAPSAGNMQPWEFYVVRDERTRRMLAVASWGQDFLARAPVVIVVCAVPGRSAVRYGERGIDLYCLQDTALAGQNILLAAAVLGLGSCWVGAFDEDAVSAALEAPPGLRPVGIIPVGYPGGVPHPPRRRERAEITHVIP